MAGHKFNILHLITRLDLGGAQQNTLFCVGHHDRAQFEVALAAGEGGILDEEAREIPDANVQLLSCLKHPISPWHDFRAVLALRRLMRETNTDLVHTHSSKAGIVGRMAALLAGVPAVVHTAHGWSFNATQPQVVQHGFAFLERIVAGWTDRIVVVSSGHREAGLARGIGRPNQYEVVRSGVDLEEFRRPQRDPAAVRRELGFEDGQVVVGAIACLKAQKAPQDFVAAARHACAAQDNLRFFIAGDGPLRETLERELAAAGLQQRVRLLGWRRDVVDLLHAMDLFLLTSRFEGLPRSVVQAIAAGTAVVATAVDGTPEVITHQHSGLLVPPGEPEAAAAAVLELAADPVRRQRYAAAAREQLAGTFDIHEMVRRLDAMYLSILREKARPADAAAPICR